MNAVFAIVLKTIKGMLLSLLGEKLVAKMTFSFLTYLAERTDTNIDNELVGDWKDAYYGQTKGKS